MITKTGQRRFSIEDDFMKARVNGQLYGLLRSLSTQRPLDDGKYEEYLLDSTYNKSKQVLMKVCGIKTTKTLSNQFKKLIAAGLVEEDTIMIGGYEYKCYKFPYDYDGLYKLVKLDLLELLVNTGNELTLKIYLYLLNCSTKKDDYQFTLNEIKRALGFSETTKTVDKLINDSLKVYKKLEIIDYEEGFTNYLDKNGIEQKKPIKTLKKVATTRPSGLY